MSNTNTELFERAIQIINQDLEIYGKLNTTQFDEGLDLLEIYSECYDINNISNNNKIQRKSPHNDQETINNYENEKEFEINDTLIQLQFLLNQLQDLSSNDTRYQKIRTVTKELICFIEKHRDIYKKFQIQSDQLIYLRIYTQEDPIQTLIIKQGLNLLIEWLVGMLYKLKIRKNIEFETKSQARLQYQVDINLEFILNSKDQSGKNKKEYKQKIKETLLAEQLIMAEILSEGFALSKLTEYIVGSLQGGFCQINEWIKRVIQIAKFQIIKYDKK